jgi:hypothetical protein
MIFQCNGCDHQFEAEVCCPCCGKSDRVDGVVTLTAEQRAEIHKLLFEGDDT